MSSPSFARFATTSANTKRSPEPDVDDKIGEPEPKLLGLSITPLMPVDPEVAAGLPLNSPRESKQTFVEGALDILEGDWLVVAGTDYAIRSVAEWPGDEAFLHLVVEEIKIE